MARNVAVFAVILLCGLAIFGQSNNTIIINGQRFVLVPEKTFSKIEKLTDELPAVRTENEALKAKSVNDDKIIAKDADLIKAQTDRADALDKARQAEHDRAEALSLAFTASQNALKVSEADRVRLEAKVKRYRNYAILGGIATVLTYVLLK